VRKEAIDKRAAPQTPRCLVFESKHLLQAGIFTFREFRTVTTIFNKSPLSLKVSKPTASQAARHPGTLAAWNKRRMESKAAFVSAAPFPCQKGGIFPDARASEKRLQTFLYHYTSKKLADAPSRQDDDEEVEDDGHHDDEDV